MGKVYRSLQDFDSIGNEGYLTIALACDTSGHGRSRISLFFELQLGVCKPTVARRWKQFVRVRNDGDQEALQFNASHAFFCRLQSSSAMSN
jgi:hypothetical protein